MTIVLIISTLILTLGLVIVAGIRIPPSIMSHFELKRRSKNHDAVAQAALAREERLTGLATLLWLKVVLLFFLVIIFALLAFGWGWGVVYGVVVAVAFGALARTSLIQTIAQRVWRWYEPTATVLLRKIQPILQTLRIDAAIDTTIYRRFDSRQELEHLLERSGTILTTKERQLLVHGLRFSDTTVRDVMTPRGAIDSIKKDEFLGPLVLSELHDLGHSRLPVTDGDLDHIIGVLHLRDLLSLDNKRSSTAEKMMDARVYYIHADDTLDHALAAFISSRHHLFIVINDARETVGLLSLEDVIEALIGRSIMDEDDHHENLKAVAIRRGLQNNQPKGHVDL